eukprot:312842-Pleurochrysis_carterae.AAC.1
MCCIHPSFICGYVPGPTGNGEAGDGKAGDGDEKVTPNRKRLRENAAARLAMQGVEMTQKALRKDKAPGVLDVGTIVQVLVADVDCARVDDVNVTVVVVEQASKQAVGGGEISKEIKYRLACKAGVIKTLYGRSDPHAFVDQTPAAHGLQVPLEGWQLSC